MEWSKDEQPAREGRAVMAVRVITIGSSSGAVKRAAPVLGTTPAIKRIRGRFAVNILKIGLKRSNDEGRSQPIRTEFARRCRNEVFR